MRKEIGSETWEKKGDWWQKIIISKMGVPVYSYHYLMKSGKPGIVFEIDAKIIRRFCGYTLIEKDMRDVIAFLGAHHKIVDQGNSTENDFLVKALVRAIAITYGKCFVNATEGRKVTLKRNIISDKNQTAHDELMEMRHQYVAHAGESIYESCMFAYLLPQIKKNRKSPFETVGFIELRQCITTANFLISYESLFKEVHDYIKDKLQLLEEKVDIFLKNLSLEKFYELAKKNKRSRVILTEADLEKMKNAQ